MPATMSYEQIKSRQKDIDDELERLDQKAKDKGLDEKDEEYFRALVDEFHRLDKERKDIERERALVRVRKSEVLAAAKKGHTEPTRDLDDDPVGEPESIEDRKFDDPFDLSEVRTFNKSSQEIGQELHARALSAVEVMKGANQERREHFTRVLEEFDTEDGMLSRFALVTGHPDYLRAFTKLARSSGKANLTAAEQAAVDRVNDAARALSLTNADGGFLVPFQLDPSVIITSEGSLNEIRQAARQVVAIGDKWHGVSAGAVQWRWAAEASPSPDVSPTFAQPEVEVHKADGFVPISLEALQDAQNITQEVGRLLVEGKDDLESEAFISGSGNGQPQGIIDALSGTASSVDTGAANTFAESDVYGLDGAVPAKWRRRGSWLAHRRTYNAIRQFDEAGGHAAWAQLAEAMPRRMLERPAYEAEEMDSGTATGDEILVFGDFNHYIIADRVGFTVEFIPHLFQQATAGAGVGLPTGQRGWYAYYRVGADLASIAPFRLLTVGGV